MVNRREKPSLSTHGKFERRDFDFVKQLADDAASSMAIHVTSEVVFIYNRDSFRRQLFDAWEESIIDRLQCLANEEEHVMKKPTRRDDSECDNREPLTRRRATNELAKESHKDASAQGNMMKCEVEAHAQRAAHWADTNQPKQVVKPCALDPAACVPQKMDALAIRVPLVQHEHRTMRRSPAVAAASTLPQPSPTPPAHCRQDTTKEANATRDVAAAAPVPHLPPNRQESRSGETSQLLIHDVSSWEQSQEQSAAESADVLEAEQSNINHTGDCLLGQASTHNR